jgi:hypothetical protein
MEFLIIFLVYTARVYCINDGKGWDNAPSIGKIILDFLAELLLNLKT